MTLDDRFRLFGDATGSLAAESVWLFRQENSDWPLWEEAVEFLAESQEVGDLSEAERRLNAAIQDGEVVPKLRAGGRLWGVALNDAMADRIARRYMDVTMPRRDREERC